MISPHTICAGCGERIALDEYRTWHAYDLETGEGEGYGCPQFDGDPHEPLTEGFDPSGGEDLSEALGQGWGIRNFELCPVSGDPHAWGADWVETYGGHAYRVIYCQECGLDYYDSEEYEEIS